MSTNKKAAGGFSSLVAFLTIVIALIIGVIICVIFGVIIGAIIGLAIDYFAKNQPNEDTHVKCPDCRELIIKDARKCKHCGCNLIPQ